MASKQLFLQFRDFLKSIHYCSIEQNSNALYKHPIQVHYSKIVLVIFQKQEQQLQYQLEMVMKQQLVL